MVSRFHDLASLPYTVKPGSFPYKSHSDWRYPKSSPVTNSIPVFNSDGTVDWMSAATYNALLDHGTLLGLTDDDHTQYLLVDGSRDAQAVTNFIQEFKSTGTNEAASLKITGRRSSVDKDWHISARGGNDTPNDRLAFYNVALGAEVVTFSNAGGLSVNAVVDPGAGIINANSGFRVANGAASGNFLRGDGTNFVANTIQSGDIGGSDLPSVSREIPCYITATVQTAGVPQHADEVATNFTTVTFFVPTTWDNTANISIETIWFCDNTGLVDLETEIVYSVLTDETALTTVQSFTNSNLTWSSANVTKVLTTTLTAASVASSRHYRIRFRRNTGDANTGVLYLMGARVATFYQ